MGAAVNSIVWSRQHSTGSDARMSNLLDVYKDKKNINAVLGMKYYVHRMLTDGSSGGKALLLDQETLQMLSMVYSQTELLEAEVYEVSQLADDRQQNKAAHQHLRCVVFIRPEEESVRELALELENPRYGSYDIYFSNIVDPGGKSTAKAQLLNLAEADKSHLVNSVQEFYGDYFAMQDVLFSIEELESAHTYTKRKVGDFVRDRSVQAISSFLLAHKRPACVRYQHSSGACKSIAQSFDDLVKTEREIHGFQSRAGTPLLLLFDRREDPVSPLIKPWTYQAMLHEYVGMTRNTVDLSSLQKSKVRGAGAEDGEKPDEETRFVLAPGWGNPDKNEDSSQDVFFAKQMYNDFATLSEAFIKMLDKYKKNNHRELNADGDISIEALKDLVDNMPEMKHKSGIIGKHLSMLSQFKDQLQARDVWTTSEIEQDLACEDLDKDEGKSRILDFVYPKDPSDPETPPCRATGDDLLRLVMLWALKYEDRDDRELLNMLQDKGVRNADDMLGSLIEYAGREARDKSWNNLMAKAKKRDAIKRMANFWKDAPDVNIFLRHQPLIVGLLDKAFAGELAEADFPMQCGDEIDSPTEVIVFIVGGATYCEAAAVAKYNEEHPGKKVVLGGTCVHNSESFLQLVAQQPR